MSDQETPTVEEAVDLTVEESLYGVIGVADQIRPEAAATIGEDDFSGDNAAWQGSFVAVAALAHVHHEALSKLARQRTGQVVAQGDPAEATPVIIGVQVEINAATEQSRIGELLDEILRAAWQ